MSAAIAGPSNMSIPSPTPAMTRSQDRLQRFIVWVFPARAFQWSLCDLAGTLPSKKRSRPFGIADYCDQKPDQGKASFTYVFVLLQVILNCNLAVATRAARHRIN